MTQPQQTSFLKKKKKKEKRERGKAPYSIVEVPSQKIAYLDNNGVVSTLARISAGRVKHITKQWLTACLHGCLADCQLCCGAAMMLFVRGEKRRQRHASSSGHKHGFE